MQTSQGFFNNSYYQSREPLVKIKTIIERNIYFKLKKDGAAITETTTTGRQWYDMKTHSSKTD